MQTKKFAYLAIDEDEILIHQGGDLQTIGLPIWTIGQCITDEALFLTGFFPMQRAYESIPAVSISRTNVVDIHLFKENALSWVIFADTTEDIKWQHQARQKSNELHLLKQQLDKKITECNTLSDFDFFEALNMMAFLVTEQGEFKLLRPFSKEFHSFYPEAFDTHNAITPHIKFPFLENFIIDAQHLWDKKIHQQQVDSGPWVEQTEQGENVILEAKAIYWDDKQLLFIEIKNSSYQQHHKLLQRGRENALIKNKLEREVHQQSAAINFLETYDTLTKLPNRHSLLKRLAAVVGSATRYKQQFALLVLDLDEFKGVNDSLGHTSGDEMLRVIAKRLDQVVRDIDYAARLGGDEFCIILEDMSDAYSAAHIAEKCLNLIIQPMVISGRTITPRASIGISIFPEDGNTPKQLLSAADTAMYSAKKAGKHQYAYYTPKMTEVAAERILLERDLRSAIATGQFELYYQPQISMQSGKMTGVEALVRWSHPEKGLISPNEFIHIAERMGLIGELTEWIVRTACEQAIIWQKSGIRPFKVAINISGTHFQQKTWNIVKCVTSLLKETGLDPKWLELEITEDVVQITQERIETFNQIKDLGISIAIDDFKTGFSSLSSLKQLPVNCLTIDRVFITDVLTNKNDSIIIATIIAMGQSLNISVLAEGVETLEQVNHLRNMGCDLIQGYFFSKPVEAKKVIELTNQDFLKLIR